jgi:chemotaxis protein methyltransferase CheR
MIQNITDGEFKIFQKLIFDTVGISLDDSKKSLVQSRLYKRLLRLKLEKYSDYLRIVQVDQVEKIEMINQITTNETYFFREQRHFDFLADFARSCKRGEKITVWSAAASVGAEAYTIAMLLDSIVGRARWGVVGTDINTEVIKKARMGLYPEAWIEKIPPEFRSSYCLKGKGKFAGQFLMDRGLVKNMHFEEGNLLKSQPHLGKFDVIFLRNVLIYFNDETKQQVVDNCLANLNPGGYFIISLTENLQNLNVPTLTQVQTSVYQKKA